jgi:hypothetical protein
MHNRSQGELVMPVPRFVTGSLCRGGIVPGSVAEGTPWDAEKNDHICGRSWSFVDNVG